MQDSILNVMGHTRFRKTHHWQIIYDESDYDDTPFTVEERYEVECLFDKYMTGDAVDSMIVGMFFYGGDQRFFEFPDGETVPVRLLAKYDEEKLREKLADTDRSNLPMDDLTRELFVSHLWDWTWD